MALFDFLKVTVKEKPKAKFTATAVIAGKSHSVSNLGVQSFTAADAGKHKQGEKVGFELTMKDPKETVSIKGSGAVVAVVKGEAKISLADLTEANRQQVARFLARTMMTR
jgi:hypothetical protein